VLGGFLGDRVLPSTGLGLLGGGGRDLFRNPDHGLFGSVSNHVPALDGLHWAGPVPAFHRPGSLLGLRLWLALVMSSSQLDISVDTMS
jgi:hypothetical protein